MVLRRLLVCLLVVTGVVATGSTADARGQDSRMERLAKIQSLRTYAGRAADHVVWPSGCNQGDSVVENVLLLPVHAASPGATTVHCQAEGASHALVDMGGTIAFEDNDYLTNPAAGYLVDGVFLHFTRNNMEAICDQLVTDFGTPPAGGGVPLLPGSATVTVRGKTTPITGVPVSTDVFIAKVHPDHPYLGLEAAQLGHPGRLAVTYCGFKALVPLRPGINTIVVDLGFGGYAPGTVITYVINAGWARNSG